MSQMTENLEEVKQGLRDEKSVSVYWGSHSETPEVVNKFSLDGGASVSSVTDDGKIIITLRGRQMGPYDVVPGMAFSIRESMEQYKARARREAEEKRALREQHVSLSDQQFDLACIFVKYDVCSMEDAVSAFEQGNETQVKQWANLARQRARE